MIKESGRYSDGTPLDPSRLPGLEGTFADHAWFEFRDVLTRACPAGTVPPRRHRLARGRRRARTPAGCPGAGRLGPDRLEHPVGGAAAEPRSLPGETYTEAKTRRDTQGATGNRDLAGRRRHARLPSPRRRTRRPYRPDRTRPGPRRHPAGPTGGAQPGADPPLTSQIRIHLCPSTSTSAPTPTTASSPEPPRTCPRTWPTGT